MIGAFKQIVLVFAHRRKLILECAVDMDMACRARTAATAKRQQLIKTVVPNGFHHSQAIANFNRRFFTFAIDDNQFGQFQGSF